MKRIEFVLPVESMRGNLSGEQKLVYAQNNNPAYEAPNGTQYARNYQGRYIGSKVSKSGLKYFNVKTKSATVLNASTRLTMGTLAAVAAIRSALMKDHAQDYAQIMANLTAELIQGIMSGTGKRTLLALFYEKVADMLQGHKPNVVFSGDTSVTINNPWTLGVGVPSAALEINPVVWVKFAPLFLIYSSSANGGALFTINGQAFAAPFINAGGTLCAWSYMVAGSNANPNMQALVGNIAAGDHDEIEYGGHTVYLGATAVLGDDTVIANAKYTA